MKRASTRCGSNLASIGAVVGLLMAASGMSHAAAPVNQLTSEQIADGWVLLFDGETLFGWETHGDSKWEAAGGALVCDTGTDGWLGTTTAFCDFLLRMQYRISANGNSGIFFRADKGPTPWETGYEMQIWDKDPKFPTGSIYGVASAQYPDGKPLTDVEQWQDVEIRAEGDHITVALNGKPVLDARDAKHARGVIGIQYHYKDMKIECRNIYLKPLGVQPIFNGTDLKGWRIVPGYKSEFSVQEGGVLNIKNGRGLIETEGTWKDFVLQLDVFSNGKELNSGVFFRGDAGKLWPLGYEAQIRNQWVGDDRTKPVDYGTGGIYNRQPARKVVSSDKEWFTMTIVAHGNHMTVWVNGYQVSDYTDTNPVGMDVFKNQCRLEGGTISLQGHDPTTDLSFRKIRIAEYAPGK